eukprot:463852-Ditylum_brightwellii.AAC.1
MCQWILKANGFVVPRKTLKPLQVKEVHLDVEKKKHKMFDQLIKRHKPVDQDNDLEEYYDKDKSP